MLSSRAFAAVCPFCEALSIRSALRTPTRPPSWQSSRFASQLQRKRPGRMILSPNVSRSPSKLTPSGRPVKRTTQDSPFRAMNRTEVPPGLEAERQRRLKLAGKPPRRTISPKSMAGYKKRGPRQEGEMKALKMQQALSNVSYGQRSAVKIKISQVEEFQQFPLLPSIQQSIREDVLRGLNELSPTPIQRLAIPSLLGMNKNRRTAPGSKSDIQEFLLAAETGSGKTLAYAIPVIDAIKRLEAIEAEAEADREAAKAVKMKTNLFELDPPPLSNDPHSTSGRPRAIILLPTAELVEQIGAVFKRFSHLVKLRVSLISSKNSATVVRNRLFGPGGIDVLVATPHMVSSIAQSDPNILSRVSHLVMDEADSLLDRSFAPLASDILDRASPSLKQLILCSATIPRSLNSYLEQRFPNITRLVTPNLHAIPRRVQLSVVNIEPDPYRGNRDLACADTIWTIGRDNTESGSDGEQGMQQTAAVKRVIVFVNEREQAPELAAYLITKGIDAVALNRDTTDERRGDILSAFTSLDPVPVADKGDVTQEQRRTLFTSQIPDAPQGPRGISATRPQRRLMNNVKVLVVTDIVARGIDTVAVKNVILYDVPHSTIDFIHRLGRVGRMGRRGRGFVLVGKHDRKDVVKEIREGMFRGQALI